MSDSLFVSGINRVTIDVLDRTLTKVAGGPVVTCLSLETVRRLNGAGEWRATFPDNDPATLRLAIKSRLAELYVDGTHRMRGVVEHRALALNNSGERILTVSGRDMAAELAETPMGFSTLGNSEEVGGDVGEGPTLNAPVSIVGTTFVFDSGTQWFARDLNNDTAYTETEVVAAFAGESVLAACNMVAEHIGEHWRVKRDGSRIVEWLGTATPASGVRAVGYAGDPTAGLANPYLCYIQSFGVEQDGFEILTRVYPYGAGQGDARLNIYNHTETDPEGYSTIITGIAYIAGETALGKKIGKYIEFKDIKPLVAENPDLVGNKANLVAAKNQLYRAGLEYLQRSIDANAVTTYRLSVSHIPDALDVGTTVRVVYQDDVYEVDADLIVTEIRSRYGAGAAESHELIVSPLVRRVADDSDTIVGSLEQARIFQAHPQLNANAYTTSYRVYVGDQQYAETGDSSAEIRFWFGPEVIQLERVLFRFNIAPLVATTNTVQLDDTTTTAGSSHSHSVTLSDHDHDINVYNTGDFTPSTLEALYYAKPQDVLFSNSGSGGGVATTGSGGGATPTSSSESSHTHGLPGLSTEFGIFREDASNTFAVTDLMYSINGSDFVDMASNDEVVSLGANWYEIDLTTSGETETTLYDDHFQPVNAQNILRIQCATASIGGGKTCMIDGFLRVREIIQGQSFE